MELLELKETCGGCPAQWEGKTKDGAYVYLRKRWGCLRIDVSGVTVYEFEGSDNWDGCLDFDELKHHLIKAGFDIEDCLFEK
jgi:hypothetical protein